MYKDKYISYMITLSKETNKLISKRAITREELASIIMNEYNIKDIIDSLADYLLNGKDEGRYIVLDKDDYDKVISMFRVRGERIVGGNIVKETRGRKRNENRYEEN